MNYNKSFYGLLKQIYFGNLPDICVIYLICLTTNFFFYKDLQDCTLPLMLKYIVAFILKYVYLIITKVSVTEEIVFFFC